MELSFICMFQVTEILYESIQANRSFEHTMALIMETFEEITSLSDYHTIKTSHQNLQFQPFIWAKYSCCWTTGNTSRYNVSRYKERSNLRKGVIYYRKLT